MSTALVPSSFQELMQISEMIAGARGLVPNHVQSPAHAAALIMRGAELGLAPMESLSALHLIDGKVSLSADTMLKVAIAGGVRVSYPDFTSERVTVELTRPGFEPFRCTWDLKMAKNAQLAGRQNYRKFPRAMLRARAVSEAVRAYCPDLLSGAYLPEELTPDRVEVTQERPAPAAPAPEPIEDAEIDAFFSASWGLIMPANVDDPEQARRLLKRLRTEDGKKGLRHKIYKQLVHIIDRMEQP